MTFTQAVKTCLTEKYATFSGRASRSEYWWFTLFNCLVSLGIFFLGALFNSVEVVFGISILLCLLLLLPGLAVCVRRLHDTGRSAWWLLVALVPYVGSWILLVIYCLPSDLDIQNKYGRKAE